MLSYKHHYHAGNFADVHKHLALITILTALGRKKTAYMVLDTHAGSGWYDLQALPEKHTTEHRCGIARLWDLRDSLTSGFTAIAPLATYLNFLQTLNPNNQQLRYYPGSPVITQHLLRPQDHLQLLELHPFEYQSLKQRMHKKRQISVHQRDAYEGLVALSPPQEKRGLVLIDPSYEIKNEGVYI